MTKIAAKTKKKSSGVRPGSAKGVKATSPFIVWAVDPFAPADANLAKTVMVLRTVSKDGEIPIQPVFVLSPDSFNFTGDFSDPWFKKYEPKVQAAFSELLPKLGLAGVRAPEVLVNKQASLKLAVKSLVSYAERKKAQAVVISNHARTGLTRMFLGSFAETALMTSKIPLIMVNPQSKAVGGLKKVLFPTDLTKSSQKAFKKAIEFCKQHQAQLILYHKLPDPIEPMVQTGVYMAGGGWVSVKQFIEQESDSREKESRKWVDEAAKQGVDTKFYIEEKPGFITDSINQYIDTHGVDLVAMGSKSGPVSSVLIGSVARQLVREAGCPVWVVHV